MSYTQNDETTNPLNCGNHFLSFQKLYNFFSFQTTQNKVKRIILANFHWLHKLPQAHNSSLTEPTITQEIPSKS